MLLSLMPLLVAAAPVPPAPALSPNEIAAAAPASEWVTIDPKDLLVMDLAADAKGHPRRVVIQLMPAPFSQGWVGNIRKLAAAHWYDGTSVNRVQDNYVVQWGDANSDDPKLAKRPPDGLVKVPESEYVSHYGPIEIKGKLPQMDVYLADGVGGENKFFSRQPITVKDPYAPGTMFRLGWPVALDASSSLSPSNTKQLGTLVSPIHCYGMVGVGRGLPPDTGTGAELYTVIGTPPRHLDRNIALVGRVVEGIEHLSSLPRGTEALGFYKTAEERVPIVSIRIASELPAADQPHMQYLSTESATFARYADARANRRDPFFIKPAGGADICNVPVPIRHNP